MVLATLIWGFGFTATVWCLDSFSPAGSLFARFAVAVVVSLILSPFLKVMRANLTLAYLKLACVPGVLLGSLLLFQTMGLQYTSTTNSGFITTLYIVLVPIFEGVFLRKKIHPTHSVWVLMALVGTGLIVNIHIDGLNRGDALTFVCSIFAAIHIIVVGKIAPKLDSAFAFNFFQALWALGLASLALVFLEGPHFKELTPRATLGISSLAIASTIVAFWLQVKAQKALNASLSSLLFLLESPFAMFFGILILGETVTGLQSLGAMIIFTSAYLAVRFEAAA
jgi:drug/metabolite transporter (DMT)-like permease